MEMLSSFRGDKHVFCLVVIKFKHVHSCNYIKVILSRKKKYLNKINLKGVYRYKESLRLKFEERKKKRNALIRI